MSIRLMFGVLLLGVTAAGCGSSSAPSAPTSPTSGGGSGNGVSIVNGASGKTTTAYAPNPMAVSVGGTITWTNSDNTTHTSTADGGAWNSGSIAPGASFSHAFPAAGTFTYHCSIHPGMVGTITVQ
jgi:plastocyanin